MDDIDWTDHESSNIRRSRHDPGSNHMDVEFHSGAVYRYKGVTPGDYNRFVTARSQGSYLHKHFRAWADQKRIA
jgi:hypothetical protein